MKLTSIFSLILDAVFPRRKMLRAAKIGEGTHEYGVTRIADNAISAHHLLLKATGNTTCDICGASAVPLGTAASMGAGFAAAADNVAITLLNKGGTVLMVASEAIAITDQVYTAANGKVQNLPAGAGTYYMVGSPVTTAGADGDIIEVQACAPVRVVVS